MSAAGSRPLAGGSPGLASDASHLITVADFLHYGERHGIDYRFAGGEMPCHSRCSQAVLKGRVFEEQLRPGWYLTFSDVDVLHPYDSCSTMASPLFVCVVLEGRIKIDIGGRAQHMEAGNALSARLAQEAALRVHQPSGQRLRTLNLALDDGAIDRLAKSHGMRELLNVDRPQLHIWPLPGFLAPAIEQALKPMPSYAQRQMMLEALGLQMLALGLPNVSTITHTAGLSPDEQRRLEQVRQHLHDAPSQPYQLKQLADMASMSQSSLRAKFQRCFGISLFDYLREIRLQLAHELLRNGQSVQQAAWQSGYSHTSNFSTAFRRRFGLCPSRITPHSHPASDSTSDTRHA